MHRLLSLVAGGALLAAAGAQATPRSSRGLTIVTSHIVTLPAGSQRRGTVDCPRGKVPFGGGGFIDDSGTARSLNGSFPTPTGWTVDADNASATDTSFFVSLVCGFKPKRYTLSTGLFTALPAGATVSAFASCPSGSLPLGGGSDTSSGSPLASLTGSFPLGPAWQVNEVNGSSADAAVRSLATCGFLRSYATSSNGPILLAPHDEALVEAGCPGGRVAIGGGVTSQGMGVTVNSTGPDAMIRSFWANEVNNTSSVNATATAWAVCAKP
jgi:hypothetical protein